MRKVFLILLILSGLTAPVVKTLYAANTPATTVSPVLTTSPVATTAIPGSATTAVSSPVVSSQPTVTVSPAPSPTQTSLPVQPTPPPALQLTPGDCAFALTREQALEEGCFLQAGRPVTARLTESQNQVVFVLFVSDNRRTYNLLALARGFKPKLSVYNEAGLSKSPSQNCYQDRQRACFPYTGEPGLYYAVLEVTEPQNQPHIFSIELDLIDPPTPTPLPSATPPPVFTQATPHFTAVQAAVVPGSGGSGPVSPTPAPTLPAEHQAATVSAREVKATIDAYREQEQQAAITPVLIPVSGIQKGGIGPELAPVGAISTAPLLPTPTPFKTATPGTITPRLTPVISPTPSPARIIRQETSIRLGEWWLLPLAFLTLLKGILNFSPKSKKLKAGTL